MDFRLRTKLSLMKNIFSIFIISIFLISNTAQAQNECYDYNPYTSYFEVETYDSTHQKQDLEKAKNSNLLLPEKVGLLNSVAFHNCNNKYGTEAAEILEDIKNDYIQKVIGNWNLEISGSNWGFENTPKSCKCTKKLRLSKDTVEYLQNDSTISKIPIKFTTIRTRFENSVSLVIEADKHQLMYFEITLTNEPFNHGIPSVLFEDEQKQVLYLRELFVACGASEEYYSREND